MDRRNLIGNLKYSKVDRWNNNFTLILEKCRDTDDGHVDIEGDGCNVYETSDCGRFDDGDFQSNVMCCICRGHSNAGR